MPAARRSLWLFNEAGCTPCQNLILIVTPNVRGRLML